MRSEIPKIVPQIFENLCRNAEDLHIEVRTKAFRSEQKEQKIQEFEKQLLDFLLFLCIYSIHTDC